MLLSTFRHLPLDVYTPEQVAQAELAMAEHHQVDLYGLMKKAAASLFELIEQLQNAQSRLCILLGKGNNAGDGFALARLAQQAGWQVVLVAMPGCASWRGVAQQAKQDLPDDCHWLSFESINFADYDVVVDCVLGIGFKHKLTPQWQAVFKQLNQQARCIVSADVPSGLNAATGYAVEHAVCAHHTVTFLALKLGLLTGDAKDHCGRLHFADLDAGHYIRQKNNRYYRRLELNPLKPLLSARYGNSHKGNFGRLLCIGGDKGMSGAIRLAASAALRSGAGTVTVLTHPDNYQLVASQHAELMVYPVNGLTPQIKQLIEAADCLLVGPGLGRSGWANGLMQYVCQLPQAKVIDADGLNWLADNPQKQHNWILTPHPGEAARLLKLSSADVQQNRFNVASEIQSRFGGVTVLKGAGSIICSEVDSAICTQGNPGMASGGMGDLLAGLCAGLVAQNLKLSDAAELAVCVHASAGDKVAEQGQRGMIASDLLPMIRQFVNQAVD